MTNFDNGIRAVDDKMFSHLSQKEKQATARALKRYFGKKDNPLLTDEDNPIELIENLNKEDNE